MPQFILGVTMDPSCHFPSTWKTGKLGLLTDAIIREYERAGKYGPEAKERRLCLDNAKVVRGVTRLPKVCEHCHADHGHFMTYSYLPKSGYFCNTCREHFHEQRARERERIAFAKTLQAFE